MNDPPDDDLAGRALAWHVGPTHAVEPGGRARMLTRSSAGEHHQPPGHAPSRLPYRLCSQDRVPWTLTARRLPRRRRAPSPETSSSPPQQNMFLLRQLASSSIVPLFHSTTAHEIWSAPREARPGRCGSRCDNHCVGHAGAALSCARLLVEAAADNGRDMLGLSFRCQTQRRDASTLHGHT